MKIAVCGKGGSGKSTVLALLAKELAKKYSVLILDIDESNYGLHSKLGLAAPRDLLEYFGGKQGFKEIQNVSKPLGLEGLNGLGKGVAFPGHLQQELQQPQNQKLQQPQNQKQPEAPFEKRWSLSEIPAGFVVEKSGIKLMSIGKIQEFGEGCACPMGSLTRKFFENLDLEKDEFVLVDTSAGVEHFGRGIDSYFDLILVVVDPSYESLNLAGKFEELGRQAGNKVYFVLNRAETDVKGEMLAAVEVSKVAAVIPVNRELFKASLRGEETDIELEEVSGLAEFLGTGI